MARLHSSLGDRTVYTAGGLAKAQGYAATVYEDPAGTVLANLAVYVPTSPAVPGAAIPGAALVVDPWSNRPAFWDLNDREALYISVAGPSGLPGPLEPIRPDAQPQVAALATRVGTVEGVAAAAETPAGAQAKADAALADATTKANDAQQLATLADVASADRQRSLAGSQAVMADAASFAEAWANLTAWSSGTFGQVSAGRLYSASQGANSGANHSFVLAAGETLRAVFNVRTVSGGASGGVIVGVTSDTAGGAFTAGGVKMTGLYFRGDIATFNNGVATIVSSMPAGTVDWTVTVTVDLAYLSVVAVTSDGSAEVRYKTARGTVNNLAVFNSDARNLTGHSVGAVGVRKGLVTVTPRTGIEGVQRTVHWTTAATNNGVRIALPPGYDSRKPSPLAICFHGNGSDENLFADNANGRVVANGLNAAGYIVLSAAYTPGTSTWGAQPGLDAYLAAYRFARDNYAIGPVVLYGNSMGGVESLLTLRDRRIPAVAWVGTSPAVSLAAAYANPTFTATIDSAYGINGGNPYAVATAGHDPAVSRGGWEWRGVPMLFIAATDDTTTPKAQHTDVLAALVGPFSATAVIPTTGGHSFDHSPYVTTIVDFFNAHAFG